MDILSGLVTGEFFGYKGEFYEIDEPKISPGATEKIPLLVGGHVDLALRRAVRKGDGWMHAAATAQNSTACSCPPRSARKRPTPATTRCT